MASRKGQDNKQLTKRDREKKQEGKTDRRLSFSAPLLTQKQEIDHQNVSDSSSQSPKESENLSPKSLPKRKLTSKDYSSKELHSYLESCFERQLDKIKNGIHEGLMEFKTELIQLEKKFKQNEEKLEALEFQQVSADDNMRKANQKIAELELKIADLEDRSRRNNLRIRGIPESVNNDILQDHITELLVQLGIQMTNPLNSLERCHRIMKPDFVAQGEPRDVMICCSTYKMKEQALKAAKLIKLNDPYTNIIIFPDISYYTRAKRKPFAL
ncbi:Hypothetical predicted protein [Pelobates cultripes]|uniref:L1 transposable element RRM domain-containing protein n=1 Tax=Pelobates cultripes TaxID=61616 RepID=A0AAD1S0M7_PELCU|nr:Hypothetical predicted protein [Pelobates cultripes]CAH2327868.1 Hypothetical predicted protein [Pelobates cultripes]